jgi:hypothetical protein
MNSPTGKHPIRLNSRVTVELVDGHGEAERVEYTLVLANQADYKAGLLGENTPLGRALLGRCAGDTVPYAVGDLRQLRILAVEAPAGEIASDAAEKRRAAVQKAANESEIVNQMIFATARGSKWGDYDVDVDQLLGQDNPQPPS